MHGEYLAGKQMVCQPEVAEQFLRETPDSPATKSEIGHLHPELLAQFAVSDKFSPHRRSGDMNSRVNHLPDRFLSLAGLNTNGTVPSGIIQISNPSFHESIAVNFTQLSVARPGVQTSLAPDCRCLWASSVCFR